MTFQEALQLKSSIDETIIYLDKKFTSNVVPENEDDLSSFLHEFRYGNNLEEHSKRLSSNGKFKVLYLHFDGANVFKKSI